MCVCVCVLVCVRFPTVSTYGFISQAERLVLSIITGVNPFSMASLATVRENSNSNHYTVCVCACAFVVVYTHPFPCFCRDTRPTFPDQTHTYNTYIMYTHTPYSVHMLCGSNTNSKLKVCAGVGLTFRLYRRSRQWNRLCHFCQQYSCIIQHTSYVCVCVCVCVYIPAQC